MANTQDEGGSESVQPSLLAIAAPSPHEEQVTSPTKSTRTEQESIDRSVITPAQTASLANQADLNQQQIDLIQGKRSALGVAKAKDAIEAANQSVKDSDAEGAARQKIDDVTLQRIKDIADKVQSDVETYKKQPAPALGADRSTWGKVVLGVMSLGGAFSDAMNARIAVMTGHPVGPSVVDDIIQSDLARQKEKILKLADNVAMDKTSLKSAEDARAALLASADARASFLAKHAIALMQARAASRGLDQEEIDKLQAVIDTKKLQANLETDAAKGTYEHINGPKVATTIDDEKKVVTDRSGQDGTAARDSQFRRDVKSSNLRGAMDALKEIPVDGITKEDLETLQRNRAAMGGSASDEPHDVGNRALSIAGRAAGVIPKSEFDGIPEAHRDAIRAYETAMVHLKASLPQMSDATSHEMDKAYGLNPGIGPVKAREKALKYAEEMQKIIDKNNVGLRAGPPEPQAPPLASHRPSAPAPTPAAPSAPKQVQLDPTPEHPHGGVGFINSDGTKEVRWNR